MNDLLYYALLCLLTIGVLTGIAMMSRVEKAAQGNALSALCTVCAIILIMFQYGILSAYDLWICLAVGLIVGLFGAYRVKMIQMPQTVALLNGLGGAASVMVAIVTLLNNDASTRFTMATAGLAVCIGMPTLTGSLVAAGKLHKWLPQKPVIWNGYKPCVATSLLVMLVMSAVIPFCNDANAFAVALSLALAFVSGLFGIVFTLRVGGADMPITISLLNALSGVAGSIAGMAVANPLLVAVGGIVGASGLILTQIMCRGMNRSLWDILLGKTSVTAAPSAVPVSEETVHEPLASTYANEPPASESKPDPAKILADAKNVIIVPGYGMALAQAQLLVKQLDDVLEAKGADVKYAIHPVAGRMPGHMNVLLCEVDVPYDKLYEIDDINPLFAECDVAVVVGANDVINPAANTAEGTPIYGMPVLDVENAKHVVICNYDLQPGYAGVPNPLYNRANVTLLTGDAKESLQQLLQGL